MHKHFFRQFGRYMKKEHIYPHSFMERPTIKSQAEKQKNKNNFLIKKGIANKLA